MSAHILIKLNELGESDKMRGLLSILSLFCNGINKCHFIGAHVFHFFFITCASTRKILFSGFANNTSSDQPAHPRSLIIASVTRFLESTISELATSEISKFLPVSVTEVTCLSLALLETLKTGFSVTQPT